MSDIINPQHDSPEQVQPEDAIPHSGNLGLELPEEKHSHPLMEDILITPDHAATLSPEPDDNEHTASKNKLRLAIVGVAATLGAGIFALLAGGGGEDDKVLSTPQTTVELPTATTIDSSLNPELGPELGEVKIPTSDDPKELLETLLYNRDCFTNTGNEACSENLVLNPHDVGEGTLVSKLRQAHEEVLESRKYGEYRLTTTGTVIASDFTDASKRTIKFKAVQDIKNGVLDEVFTFDGEYELRPKVTQDQDGNTITEWLVSNEVISNGRLVSSQ